MRKAGQSQEEVVYSTKNDSEPCSSMERRGNSTTGTYLIMACMFTAAGLVSSDTELEGVPITGVSEEGEPHCSRWEVLEEDTIEGLEEEILVGKGMFLASTGEEVTAGTIKIAISFMFNELSNLVICLRLVKCNVMKGVI